MSNKIVSFKTDLDARSFQASKVNMTQYDTSQLPHADYFHSNGLHPEGNATICNATNSDPEYAKWAYGDVLDARRHQLRYRHPHEPRMVGKLMDINERHLQLIVLPLAERAIPISKINVSNFTIVTGCSGNHFVETTKTLPRFTKVFPKTTIIFYDFGELTEKHVSWVSNVALFCKNIHSYIYYVNLY